MSRIRNYLNRDFKKKRSKDLLPKKRRSELMSKIRSKKTKFEQKFVSALKKLTRKKFQTNVISIKGKPDIVFLQDKVCVFLDSDFWHGWQYTRWKHLLKNDFWRTKIENNRKRDRRVNKSLRVRGWKILRIWEHEIKKDSEREMQKVIQFFYR